MASYVGKTPARQAITADNTITSAKIVDNTISTSDILDSTITGSDLASDIVINTTGSITSGALTVDTDTLYVDSTNNRVGIGTTTPAQFAQLHLYTSNATHELRIQTGEYSIGSLYSDVQSTALYTRSNSELRLGANNNPDVMIIHENNNVGIGLGYNGTPDTPLHIVSSGSNDMTLKVQQSSVTLSNTPYGAIVSQFMRQSESIIDIATSDNGYSEIWFTDVTHQGDARVRYEHTDRKLEFWTNGVEKMAIDSSGHAIIPAGVTLGTSVGTYNAANTLDDYEEGTWTPVINSGTYTLIFAKYTKIGNLCYLSFRITNFSDSSSTTDIQITGMPFAQPSNTETGVGSAYGERSDVNKPTVDINSNIIRFRNGFGVSTFDTPLQYSDINDGADFDIIANVTYETA